MEQNVPELQVLANYIGTWGVTAKTEDGPATAGQYTATWVLGGRFVQTTGFVRTDDGSNDFELLTLFTYDQQQKTYRWWTFMSNGHTEVSEGAWDEETRTMTRITRYGEITQTAKSTFADPDVETWVIVNTDKAGAVVSEMRGRNTRRESKPRV